VSTASLEGGEGGRFRVSGELDATTVTSLLKESRRRFAGLERLEIDLGGVRAADSAGLALLLEWLRLARQAGQPIRLANLPEQLVALARISEVEGLLAANGSPQTAEAANRTSDEVVTP